MIFRVYKTETHELVFWENVPFELKQSEIDMYIAEIDTLFRKELYNVTIE